MIGLLWEMYQQNRIGEAEHRAARAGERATDLQAEIMRLEQRVEQAMLINLSMWSLLQEKLAVTDTEMEVRMRELDLSDGKLDGRMGGAPGDGPTVCRKCARKSSKRHVRCIYCGEPASPLR
jgi:hypothetical protein